QALETVLPEAVRRMLDRLGKAAAEHRMYLVLCNDVIENDGRSYNTAFLLGRDGKEIGRYHKVNLPLAEQSRTRGTTFPVFPTRGKILATASEPDGLAIADIDPSGGREGGDAFNTQADMRGRLFRERVPEAYGMLTEPNPPVLAKVPSNVSREEAVRIMATTL